MLIEDIPESFIEYLGPIKNISFPQQGHTSLVIKIDTSDHQYIIKKTNHTLYSTWLADEYKAMQYLDHLKLPIPKVHRFHSDKETSWLLMDYIAGISLRHYLLSQPNSINRAKVIAQFGLCLKQLHETSYPVALQQNDQAWLDVMLKNAEYNLAHYKVAGDADLLNQLKREKLQPIKSTLIHGDFHTNNVLVQDNKIVGIIDWPRAAYGDPRFDIALAIRPKQGVFDQKGDTELFYESYGRLKITDEEYMYFQEGLYKFF